MQAWYFNELLSLNNYIDFLLRLVVSMICGAALGYEREKRLKNAGLRTHIIVALAASMMMVVSKYGFMDIVGLNGLRLQTDGSRIAAAVVQAISFIGAGVIFIRRENVIGLTTAAGLWATVGIGLAVGAGLYGVGITSTLMILVVQAVLHRFHSKSHFQNMGVVKSNITKRNITFKEFENYLDNLGVTIRDISMTKTDKEEVIISANILFKPSDSLTSLMDRLYTSEVLDSVSIYPVF